MEVLYLLVPLALIFAGGALAVFVMSVKGGQFDDLDTPPMRILFDDVEPEPRRDESEKSGSTDR